MVKNIYIRVGERSFDTQTTKRREISPCFPPASLSSPAFRSFSNAKTDENKYLEIPNGRGYPRSDKSQVAPSTRKTHSKARRTTITPSLVLDEFLFIRSILGSLLLPLFFFFFSPTTHPFLPFSRATVTSSNWHVSQFDAYTVSKKEKNIVREEERENGKGGKKKFCASSSSSSSRW